MRPYMNNEYLKNLIGGMFKTNESTLQKYNGLKVSEIIKELTEQEYDRELIDDTDKNEKGEYRYLINTMYKVKLENNEIITVFEDEINPNYHGSWVNIEKSIKNYLLSDNANISEIEDFLGYQISGDILEELESNLDNIFAQMPEDILREFYDDFCIHSENRDCSNEEAVESFIENMQTCIIKTKTNMMYELLKNHIGHNIVCVAYGDINNPDDICIECEDCNEVLISAETFEDED